MPLSRAVPVTLTAAERTMLNKRAGGAKTAYRDRLRARIVLAAARGRDNARIAADLQVTADTVRKWRGRFAARGLDGLRDLSRSGRPRRISELTRAAVVALACQLPAATGIPLSRWTGPELLAELTRAGTAEDLSVSSVLRILAEHPVKPWQYQSWISPRDPDFAAKATVILDLYQGFYQGKRLQPGDRVLSVDAKPSIQARGRCRPTVPAGRGRPMRVEHEYVRHGALALLAALDVRTGKVFAATPDSTGIVPFMDLIGQVMSRPEYRDAPRVFVIVDNGSDHRGQAAISRLTAGHPNAIMIHTPVHASWLNQVPVNRPSARRHARVSLHPATWSRWRHTEIRCPKGGSMGQRVVLVSDGHRVDGCGADGELVNRFLAHLGARAFSPATVRAYAYDLLNFLRFLAGRDARLADVVAMDLFDYLDWQQRPARTAGQAVVRLSAGRGAAPATMNRRVAAVRGLFEFAVMTGVRAENPVPAARRSTGLRPSRRGLLGHIGPGRPRSGGRLVRQPRRLPEALEPEDVAAFVADLRTFRDRAITLAMLLGGLRAAEVRSLRLADVDMGLRRVRVTGKGGKERVVPVDGVFFAELAAYLREERPAACRTAECFVVLRGPTAGQPLTEAGLRRIFRTHRLASGAVRVRPHRLRHTYGTELASAGIDLLALRDLMGHANPETTAAYVHLSPQTLAAEYARARAAAR